MPPSSNQFLRAESSESTCRARRARCSTCGAKGSPNKTSRNLIVCIDGTANKFGRKNTNVVKLFEAVDCDTKVPLPEQHTYYSSGIGTRPRILDVFQRMQRAISDQLDMAIAWNVEEIVKDAYSWLAGKYQEGDQIYLFGFSRGAYQVRILAGMIYEVGLIKNPTEKQVGAAYEHFESILSHQPNANDTAREFRRAFSWKDVRVHFIGVWDTVSSVGFGRSDVCLSASSGVAHACHIRHALALDECRVKFIPEYFLEMNSPDLRNKDGQLNSGIEASNGKLRKADESNVISHSPDTSAGGESRNTFVDSLDPHAGQGPSNTSNDDSILGDRDRTSVKKMQLEVVNAISCEQSSTEKCTDRRAAEIKEVWFAGTHSDVGGTHRPGTLFHAGNVSLMWMRREAHACGLLLKPEDILWTDEDIDLGTIDSMTFLWKLVEYLPIRHQVSFSGTGRNARRLHLFQPRRIIPGQKIHASVQFANTYVPKATFGNGFGNPLETAGPMLSRDNDVWEKDAIDHTTYAALFDNLTGRQGTAPFYLHRLLFMLRFVEGRWPIKEVSDQRKTLTDLISKQSGLVRLVAIAAYFEAVDSPELGKTLPEDVFVEATQSLAASIKFNQPDWPRAIALLRPLAKHTALRYSILTVGVIDGFLRLLDHITIVPGEHFAHVMDALSSLVEFYPEAIINKLAEAADGTTVRDRLSLLLDTNDSRHLTAVLRVVVFIAETAPRLCRKVKPRLQELAEKRRGPVSLLAVQALVQVSQGELYEESMAESVFSYTSHVSYLHASSANISPSRNWRRRGDSLLYQLFPAGALGNSHRRFIQRVLNAADGNYTRARTAATFTLLKLCEVNNELRMYLLDQGVLRIFIGQLQFRDSALLAAYALTKCLTHRKFRARINRERNIAGYIVNMIRLDYFDEAVGVVEGFAIFEDLMKYGELRGKILEYNIAALLERKLGAGKPRGMRTGLIYLNVFRTHGEHALTWHLMERGLLRLKTDRWWTQRPGVAILCSLAQTWFGTEALTDIIPEVINMLLPTHDPNNHHGAHDPKPPSSLLGPAFVLRVLADNEPLRMEIRQTAQYARLKHLFLFGDLIHVDETPIWRVYTPTRDDVLDVITQAMTSVDAPHNPASPSRSPHTHPGFILPHVQHWRRLAWRCRNTLLGTIVLPTAVAGVAALMLVGAVVVVPVVVGRRVIEWAGRSWRLSRQDAAIRRLRLSDDAGHTPGGSEASEVC